MRKLLVFISLFFLIFGCGGVTQNKDYHYAYCINSKTQKKLTEGYGIKKDIFTLLKEAETVLLDTEIIADTGNASYLKLAEITFSNQEAALKTAAVIKTKVNNHFFDLLALCTLDFFSYCPYQVLEKIKNNDEKRILYQRFMLYDELTSQAYNNKEKIIELINEDQNLSAADTRRLTILNLLLLNMTR